MDGEAMEAMRHIMRSQAAFAGMEGADVLLYEQSLSYLRAGRSEGDRTSR